MLAFEVTINGQRRYLAGHVDAQTIQLILSGNDRFERSVSLTTFVAVPDDSSGGPAALSYEAVRIDVGDEVRIRIVDVESADRPKPPNGRNSGYQIEMDASE